MNKASGGDGILAELFQTLHDDAVKVLHSHVSKFRKLSSGYRTGKGQFSFRSQRRAMSKNVQTTQMFKLLNVQTTMSKIVFILHASKVMFKILQARLQ